MDNLTHSLLGAGLANAGLAKRFGRGTTLTLILASNLPDLDALWAMGRGGEAFLLRRTLTHSVFGAPLLAALAAWLLGRVYKNQSWRSLFGLCLVGLAGHMVFDLVNSYGICLLYPLSDRRFELSWVFIIDLALWGLLLFPLLLAPIRSRWTDLTRLSRASLAGVAAYVGFCAAGHARAMALLDRTARAEGLRPEFSYAFPEALGPHRFRGVLKEAGVYRFYLVRCWQGTCGLEGEYPTEEEAPAVRAARATPRGRRVDWFFKAPVWRAATDGGAEVYDLRFKSLVLKWPPRNGRSRRTPFLFRFPPAELTAGV